LKAGRNFFETMSMKINTILNLHTLQSLFQRVEGTETDEVPGCACLTLQSAEVERTIKVNNKSNAQLSSLPN
jgi:hypothetical protein